MGRSVVPQLRAVRRAVALLLAALTLTATLTAVTGSSAGAAAAVDARMSQRECSLTGRVFVKGRGCSRHHCVPGARMYKEGHDAELCELPGRGGAAYGQPINSRRCEDLGRVWIDEINICASNPNRYRTVVEDAPQCRNRAATYLNHSEEEGHYDECVSPRRLKKLRDVARRQNLSLNKAAADRNRFNCSYRAGWEMRDGVCVVRDGPPRVEDLGGTFVTGDSVSWRADDELYRRAPRSWTLDLRPGRRLDELDGRLDWFRANHGDPDRVIIQLGTNRRAGYTERDFRNTIASIPDGTPVLFFLPYRKFTGDNANLVAATKRYAGWMKSLAPERPMTCLADWPSYAAKHLTNLVDGEHPDSLHEDWYARYVLRAWSNCERQLGL
jgi:hypothetical protein